jgi:hypothetical protein
MTDLEAKLRRGMDGYVRTRPVSRPPLDELLDRLDRQADRRPARPGYRLTTAGIAAAAAAVVGVVVWRGAPDEVTAAPAALGCAPFTASEGPATADDHEIILFLERDITEEQRMALEDTIDQDPRVTTLVYYDRSASAAEYRRLFRDNEAMLERIEERPELLPTSYRTGLASPDQHDLGAAASAFAELPGVLTATTVLTCD